jgi:hypothetical protein
VKKLFDLLREQGQTLCLQERGAVSIAYTDNPIFHLCGVKSSVSTMANLGKTPFCVVADRLKTIPVSNPSYDQENLALY